MGDAAAGGAAGAAPERTAPERIGRDSAARITSMGERALLARAEDVIALYLALDGDPLPHQAELVPGGESLLVTFTQPVTAATRAALAARLDDARAAAAAPTATRIVLDTCYDGADLAEVADVTGLSIDGVIAAHTGTEWQVAFGGFAPGFSYLSGGDGRLEVPRRAAPRTEVPAGAVGLAGSYSGIYPRPSPGGWQLIGHVAAPLWDADRRPPALLQPGMRVTFRAVRADVLMTPSAAHSAAPRAADGRGADDRPNVGPHAPRDENAQGGTPPPDDTAQGGTPPPDATPPAGGLRVVNAGMQLLVQDLGRFGYAAMGVSPSGAADRRAAIRANRLVGNPDDAAVLEILFGAVEFVAEQDMTIALTGAPAPITLAEPDAPAEPDQPLPVVRGQRIRLRRPRVGLRSYLAVAGGIDVPPVLGSRSTDLLSGLGPDPVRAGDLLPIGARMPEGSAPVGAVIHTPAAGADRPGPGDRSPAAAAPDDAAGPAPVTVDLLPGPQWDEFLAPEELAAQPWTIAVDSNRIGVRLVGPVLRRRHAGEIASQGLVRGAIQVPPSGQPIVFLADHPVTGGYPVIGVLTAASVDRLAQCRPGATVQLTVRAGGAG